MTATSLRQGPRPRGRGGGCGRRGAEEEEKAPMSPQLELQTFVPPDIASERRDDGSTVLASRRALGEIERSITAVLRRRAAEHPDRPLAAQRDAEDGWVTLSYGEAERRSRLLATAFARLGLGQG